MTYQPSLCVITPTIGRPTLRRTLESGELGPDDSWMVLYDCLNTFSDETMSELVSQQGIKLKPYHDLVSVISSNNTYGNHARDMAMMLCQGEIYGRDYFFFLDDDDVFAPGAVEIIKRELAQYYPSPVMFRMVNGNGEILWRTREVTPGNVGGSMFCCPNIPDRLGKWQNGAGHRSDFEFIMATLKNYGESWRQSLMWSGEVVVHCRPGEGNEKGRL